MYSKLDLPKNYCKKYEETFKTIPTLNNARIEISQKW